MKQAINWVAIRETDGEEWIDIKTISSDQMDCRFNAIEINKSIPQWAKDNPVRRFVQVETKILTD